MSDRVSACYNKGLTYNARYKRDTFIIIVLQGLCYKDCVTRIVLYGGHFMWYVILCRSEWYVAVLLCVLLGDVHNCKRYAFYNWYFERYTINLFCGIIFGILVYDLLLHRRLFLIILFRKNKTISVRHGILHLLHKLDMLIHLYWVSAKLFARIMPWLSLLCFKISAENPQIRVGHNTKRLQDRLFTLCSTHLAGTRPLSDTLKVFGYRIQLK